MPHFNGSVGPPDPGHHRWQPCSRRPLVTGSAYYRHLARLMLQELRAGNPSPEYGLRISAFLLMLVLHLGFFFMMLVGRPPAALPDVAAADDAEGVQIRLIETPAAPVLPPPIEAPPRPPAAAQARIESKPVSAQAVKPEPPAKTLPASIEGSATPEPDMPAVPLVKAVPRPVAETSLMAVPAPSLPANLALRPNTVEARLGEIPVSRTSLALKPGKQALRIETAPAPFKTRGDFHAGVPQVALPGLERPQLAQPQADTRVEPELKPVQAQLQSAPRLQARAEALAPVTLPTPARPTVSASEVRPQAWVPPKPQVRMQHQEAPIRPVATPAPVASASPPARSLAVKPGASLAPANDRFQPVDKTASGGQRPGSGIVGSVQRLPRANTDVMTRNTDQLGYKPTMFEQYWAPANETLLSEFLRKFIEKLTVKHTFHVAPGVRVHCVLGPVALFFGCTGDPPRKGSRKGDDPRLNMAPAQSLAPGVDWTPKAPASSVQPALRLNRDAACETARVAGAPPPPGCPGGPASAASSAIWPAPGGG